MRAAGVSEDQIHTLLSQGALDQRWRGVFLARGAPLTYEARLWVAVLSFGGVLGFSTAAHLWGHAEQPDRIQLIIPRSAHRWRNRSVRTHRIDLLARAVTTREGLPITSRRETLLDHIGRLRPSEGRQLADRAVQRGWLMPSDFEHRVRTQPGRIGNTLLREIASVVGDGAAAESERLLHRLLRGARLSGWQANTPIWHRGELIAVVDVAFRAERLAIEVDGLAFHSAPDRFQRDRRRQNDVVGLGWTVLRFTWSDLVDRPQYVIATIRRQLTNSGSEAG